MSKEPAVSIGTSITGVLAALFIVLRASGIGVTQDMSDGLTALVLALCAIPAISGLLTRMFVWSPNSVQKEVDKAALTGDAPKLT